MREFRPRELADLEHVVHELDQFVGPLPDLDRLRGLRNGGQILAHMVRATAGGRDDIVVARKIPDEQRFGGGRIVLAPAVGHRLPATGLVQRVVHFDAEALEQLERRDPDLGEEGVDVAGDEQRSFHRMHSSGDRRLAVGVDSLRARARTLAHASTRWMIER